jgi:hypothetical protein
LTLQNAVATSRRDDCSDEIEQVADAFIGGLRIAGSRDAQRDDTDR